MEVKIGKYTIPYDKAKRLIDLGMQIDANKKELSKQEEIKIQETLDFSSGDVILAEMMLRNMVLALNNTPKMISIPADTFIMGSSDGEKDEQPIRQIRLSAFRIGKFEVTNQEYRAYLRSTGQYIPQHIADEAFNDYPVDNISWNDAFNYCQWLSKYTGRKFRLPTEAEWEYAARGTDGRIYPWGNKSDNYMAICQNGTINGPCSVENNGDVSPFGVKGMAGNVMEWVGDWWGNYDPKDLINPKGPTKGEEKVIRGGAWDYALLPVMRRSEVPPTGYIFHYLDVGFRVAEDLK